MSDRTNSPEYQSETAFIRAVRAWIDHEMVRRTERLSRLMPDMAEEIARSIATPPDRRRSASQERVRGIEARFR